jgi:hypothetical protein
VENRARAGTAVVIVGRATKEWGLPEIDHRIILYNRGNEARTMPLHPGSRGGEAILNHLLDPDAARPLIERWLVRNGRRRRTD